MLTMLKCPPLLADFFLNSSNSLWKLTLKFVLDLLPFWMWSVWLSLQAYNDLVICKDSNDCLKHLDWRQSSNIWYFFGWSRVRKPKKYLIGTSLADPGLEILTDKIQFSDAFSQVCSLQYLEFWLVHSDINLDSIHFISCEGIIQVRYFKNFELPF